MPARGRENMALRRTEGWQPPAFTPPTGVAARAKARARRALDLQAASIWGDLREALAGIRGTVLDVGAGAQPYRDLVPSGAEYIAIDTADAKRNFSYDVPGTRYFTGETWPLEDTSVDIVLATETLEHVPRPDAFLAEAARVLRPGGRIVLTVPFAARWHYVPHDYWRFTPSSLVLLLEAAGFREVVVHGRGNELTVACAKVMALLLPALLPQDDRSVAARVAGLAAAPLVAGLAGIGHASMRYGAAGEDTLGWTASAERA
jgi:SAM-dependent methyltransferase